ncbi:thioesterase II family protein [Lysobacter fragariae]
MHVNARNPWFLHIASNPDAPVRLFAFPYSGAAAQAFRGLGAQLGEGIDAFALQLPGRAARSHEPSIECIAALVDELLPQIRPLLDRPTVFFGYSNGALIAHELIRQLDREGNDAVKHLVVAARRAPTLASNVPLVDSLDDDALIRFLADFNGMSADVLGNAEVMAGLLPRLRSDFRLGESFGRLGNRPIGVPVDACAGRRDALAPGHDMHDWSAMTTGDFAFTEFDGDHFFINDRVGELACHLRGVSRRVSEAMAFAPHLSSQVPSQAALTA